MSKVLGKSLVISGVFFVLALGGIGIYQTITNRPTKPKLAEVRHPVTPEMWKAADLVKDVALPKFSLATVGGKIVTQESLHGKPTLMYFIKLGCPCSIDVEPLFQRMSRTFPKELRCIGVIYGGQDTGSKWMKIGRTPYDVLLDADGRLGKAMHVSRSVYTALIRPDGMIDKMWPGYSKEMLKELSRRIAILAKVDERPYDPGYAPNELASGCSFLD